MIRSAVAVCLLWLAAACTSPLSTRPDVVSAHSCETYARALDTLSDARDAGRLTQPQRDSISAIDAEVGPICKGRTDGATIDDVERATLRLTQLRSEVP